MNEIATSQATGLATIEPTKEIVQQAYAAIRDGELPPEVGDPEITRRMILARIAEGTFSESLEPSASLPSFQLRAGEPTVFLGFHLNPSAFRNGDDGKIQSAVYAVIETADPATGDLETFQFGGGNVLTQLVKAWEERQFPFVAVLTASEKTMSGFTTYWLRAPEKPVAASVKADKA